MSLPFPFSSIMFVQKSFKFSITVISLSYDIYDKSIYTKTMLVFDTMSKVCMILFQMIQKFDDVIIFLPHPREKMDSN